MSILNPDGSLRPGRVAGYGLLAAAVIVALVWGIRAYSASTSGAKGTLQIQQQRGSAGNREHSSVTIVQDYENVQADQRNIAVYAEAAARPGATAIDATNLTGVKAACNNDVATYNTDAGNALSVIPDGYPQHLDATQQCVSNTTVLENPSP